MVLREWIIDYFIGEVDEVTESDEFMFYVYMLSIPLLVLVIFLIILF